MKILQKVQDLLISSFMVSSLAFVICALLVQLSFIYIHFTKSDEEQLRIANEITWKIDGRWKDTPGNIWYEEK